jgi:acyl carrier protein
MIILDELNSIFQQVFCDDSLKITRETTANDIEDRDSLTHMNLIVFIEGQLNIKFGLKDLRRLDNVGDLLDVINVKLGN